MSCRERPGYAEIAGQQFKTDSDAWGPPLSPLRKESGGQAERKGWGLRARASRTTGGTSGRVGVGAAGTGKMPRGRDLRLYHR